MLQLPALPVVLTEQGGRGRRILLSGTDLPHDPSATTLGGSVRTATRYYPGSSIPVVQVLGAEEATIRFAGEFDDRRKGVPGWAVAQAFLLDQVRRDCAQVAFEYGPFRRLCMWKHCRIQTRELQKIAYEIELEIIDHGFGRADAVSRVFGALKKIPGLDAVARGVGTVVSVLDLLPPGIGGERLARAQAAIGQAGAAVGLASGVLDTIRAAGSVINPQLVSKASTYLSNAKGNLGEVFEHARDFDWKGAAGSAFDAVMNAGRGAASAISTTLGAVREIDLVKPAVDALAPKSSDETVYVASEGETLQRIAHRFYGDAKAWTRIAEANGKGNASVSGGEVLLIPDAPRPTPQAAAP